MAIKISGNKIEIGLFTLEEKPSMISGTNAFAAEKRSGALSFNGQLSVASLFSTDSQAITGTFSGGHINPLGTSWAGIDKFPFAAISTVRSVSNLFQSRSYASGASSRTNAYTFGGNAGTITPYLQPNNSTGVNTIDRFAFSNNLNAKSIGNLSAGGRSLSSGQSSSTSGYCTGGVGPFNSPTNTNFLPSIEKVSFSSDSPSNQIAYLQTPGYGRTGFSSATNGYYSAMDKVTSDMRIGAPVGNNGKFLFANDAETTSIPAFISSLPTVTTGASAPDAGYYITSYTNIPHSSSTYPGYIGSPAGGYIIASLARIAKFPFASETTILNVGHLYGAHPSTSIGLFKHQGYPPFYPAGFAPPSIGYRIDATGDWIKTEHNYIACSSGDTKAVLGGGSIGDDNLTWFGLPATPNVYYRLNRMDTFPFSNNSFCTYVGDLSTGRSGMVGHSDK